MNPNPTYGLRPPYTTNIFRTMNPPVHTYERLHSELELETKLELELWKQELELELELVWS